MQRQQEYRSDPEPGLLSVLTPVWDGSPLPHLRTLAESIVGQNEHAACEWVILDNGCRNQKLAAYLKELSGSAQVKLLRAETNVGITNGLRLCLEQATGRYVLPVDADDVLYRDAFRVVASCILAAGYPPLLYTDEDKVIGGRVYQPYFKPDWDPVLLLNSAYIAHLGVMDRRMALDLGVYSDAQTEGSPDWDAFIRFLIAGHSATHIPEVVYSWRVHAQSTADDDATKPYIHSSQMAALQRFLDTRPQGRNFEIRYSPLFESGAHWRFVRKEEDRRPTMTVPIQDPREKAKHLGRLVRDAEFVCLTGPDVQVDGRIGEALSLFELHPDCVMVGGCLWNHQGSIQDAGRYFGYRGIYGCPYRGRPVSDPGYFGQLRKQRSVSAVSTQLAVIRADYLLELLDAVPEDASLSLLGAWAGAHALRTGKRVAYSPFLRGISDVDWDALVDTSEMALFKEMNCDIIPDRRFYSPHFSLREPFQVEE